MAYRNIVLGLGDPPTPTYLFVGDNVDKTAPWHLVDFKEDKQIPVHQTALTGQIVNFRMLKKEFKNKASIKLDIFVQADKLYVIRSGAETNFTRGFLLAAQQVDDFSEPLVIHARQGDDPNVIFCVLYYATNLEKIPVEWDEKVKLFPIIQRLQERLGQFVQSWDDVQNGVYFSSPTPTEPSKTDQDSATSEDADMCPADPQEAPSGGTETTQEGAKAEPPPSKSVDEKKVEVPASSRTPAPAALSKRTMAADFYATEIDDLISIKELGEIRQLATTLNQSDEILCLEIMGCETSDLSHKGAAHLIHFLGVKISTPEKVTRKKGSPK